MKKFMLLATIVGLLAFAGMTVNAQTQNRVEVYTGVQYDRSDFDARNSTSKAFTFDRNTDTVGADLAVTAFVTKHVGITGDVAATFEGGVNDSSLVTALGGLTIKSRESRVQPFARVLAGVARQRIATGQLNLDTSDANFAASVGGGIDVRLSSTGRAKLRLIQADYLRVGALNSAFIRGGENHLRLGMGVSW